jgi:hypothetical protein
MTTCHSHEARVGTMHTLPVVARRNILPFLTLPRTRKLISVQVNLSRVTQSGISNPLTQSLLHGSPEAKQAGELEIQQHSRLVARGKYIHGFEG